jgi:hypothetical protein
MLLVDIGVAMFRFGGVMGWVLLATSTNNSPCTTRSLTFSPSTLTLRSR